MRVVYLKTTINQKFPKFSDKWVLLGAGIQAVVYSDRKYAYKHCRFNTNYVKWLLDLRKNKLLDNPYVPKVYKIYVDKNKKDCLVQMELLSPGHVDIMEEKSSWFEGVTIDLQDGDYHKKRLNRFEKVAKHVADFINKQERAGNTVCLDMHSGNVMMRRNQLVITDPVV